MTTTDQTEGRNNKAPWQGGEDPTPQQEPTPKQRPQAQPQPASTNRYVTNIAIGDEPEDAVRRLRLTLKMDEKARVAVLDKDLYRTRVHYHGFYFYCIGEGCPYCPVKAPSPRYMTWVWLYELDKSGRVRGFNKQGEPEGEMEGEVKAWFFGRDKYGVLAGLQAEWGDIRKADIVLQCTDEKFQRMTIVPSTSSAWMRATNRAAVPALRKATAAQHDPGDLIARTLSAQEIYGLLAAGTNDTPTTTLDAANSYYPDDPQPPVGASSHKELQNLLDSLD